LWSHKRPNNLRCFSVVRFHFERFAEVLYHDAEQQTCYSLAIICFSFCSPLVATLVI
jgi:hypothetical protein